MPLLPPPRQNFSPGLVRVLRNSAWETIFWNCYVEKICFDALFFLWHFPNWIKINENDIRLTYNDKINFSLYYTNRIHNLAWKKKYSKEHDDWYIGTERIWTLNLLAYLSVIINSSYFSGNFATGSKYERRREKSEMNEPVFSPFFDEIIVISWLR